MARSCPLIETPLRDGHRSETRLFPNTAIDFNAGMESRQALYIKKDGQ